ncbi:hypothetical protein Ddye_025341 [Dipteronia dyeriana]|uniref:Uncharacterized protein n=1 Tax=Dipteronia dyeriana TaxID=168575 RepID=A0AAD9WV15_9ROSI|nr:hypothetical protein Ddye_025341 [Dipteronia dyeriana]
MNGFFEAVMTKMEAPFEQLLDRFKPQDCSLDTIVFEVESCCYIPTPPKVSSNAQPESEPEVLDMEGGYQALGWCDLEAGMLNYEGDSEKDDDKDVEDGE